MIRRMKARLFWLRALVTIGSAFTRVGFSVAALSSSGDAQVNAMYAASRSLSLALASVVVVFAVRALGSWQWHSSWPWCREQTRLLAPFVTNRLKHSGPLFLHWSWWRYLYHYGGVPHRTKQNQPMRHPRPNQSLELTATNDSFRPRAAI